LLLATAAAAQAQNFTLNWSTLDGGGGASTGGVFAVSGTIGQPDAGKMSGGNFAVEGGFWGVIAAIQTPGAPVLTVTLNPQLATLTVAWPLPAEGWLLEQTPTLTGSVIPWTKVPANQYQTNTTHLYIAVPVQAGTQFYLLRKVP
jgi:hypothetical protein